MAADAYPSLEKVPPKPFAKALAVGEIAHRRRGARSRSCPPALAGLALTGFSGALLGMWWRTPGMHEEDSPRPTQQGTAIAKDVWMFGIGISLLLDAALTESPITGEQARADAKATIKADTKAAQRAAKRATKRARKGAESLSRLTRKSLTASRFARAPVGSRHVLPADGPRFPRSRRSTSIPTGSPSSTSRTSRHRRSANSPTGRSQRTRGPRRRKLDQLGVPVGGRVAVISQNSARLLTSFFGVSGWGRVLVPINFRLSRAEIQYIVGHSGAEVVYADPALKDTLDTLDVKHKFVLGEDDALYLPDTEPQRVGRSGRGRDRDDQLHVRHHRPSQGRATDAPQQLAQRDRVRPAHDDQRPRRLPAHAADVPRQRLGHAVRRHRRRRASTSCCARSTAPRSCAASTSTASR